MTLRPILFLLLTGLVPLLFSVLPTDNALAKEERWTCHDPIQDDIDALNRIIEDYSESDASPSLETIHKSAPAGPPVRLTHNFTTTSGSAGVSMGAIHHPATFSVQGYTRIWNFGPDKYHYFLVTPDRVGSYYDLTGMALDKYSHIPKIRMTQPTHKFTCQKETS